MNLTRIRSLLLLLGLVVFLDACKKKWEDHNELTYEPTVKTLLQQIKENPQLSLFAALVEKSGYDQVLASSKSYTVWAPSNSLFTVADSVVNDTARLRAFIGNHIALQVSPVNMTATNTSRILMLSGKYLNVKGAGIDSSIVTEANHFAKNGVLHTINKPIPVLGNIWQVLGSSAEIPARQRNYLFAQFRNVFDRTNAVQIGVDTNGNPIYKPGTDSIRTNAYWASVYDLTNESRQYTLFVMEDAGWDAEVNKMLPYFSNNNTSSANTLNLASYEVAKDLAFDTVYSSVASIPDILVSKFGVQLYIVKSSIKKMIRTSNGVIYIMDRLPVSVGNRIKEIRLEGENYRSMSSNRIAYTYIRERQNPVTKNIFKDLLITGHGVTSLAVRYQTSAYAVKYKAYWVALNDFQATSFQQKLAVDSTTSTVLPYTTVSTNIYFEQYLGEFSLSEYKQALNLYLVSSATSPIVCDYIRLVPVL